MNKKGKLYELLEEQADKVDKLHLINKRINKIKSELKRVGKNGKSEKKKTLA